MANKPTPADFSPTVPDFPSIGQYQPIYGKFDLTTYIHGASDYEIMAFLVQCYNATLKGYSDVTQLSKDTVTAYNQLQTWVNTWFDNLDVQPEINAKIQEMYENGSLAEAIASSDAMIPAIDNYFASEDGNAALSNKTSEKINDMAANGTLTYIVKETAQVPPAVTQYLNTAEGSEKLSNATAEKINNMATDGTLTDIVKETAQVPPAVTQYLNTADGYEKLSNATAEKINNMANTGELGTVISGTTDLQKTTTDWLHNNVTPVGSAVVVDKSLTIEGAAADSKATGNSIDALRGDCVAKLNVPVYNLTIPSPYNDFNTMPDNVRFGTLGQAWQDVNNVLNGPDAEDYTGIIETITLADNVKIQRFYDNKNDSYSRILYGANWTTWIEDVTSDNVGEIVKSNVPTYQNNYFSSILESFDNITCVGDSLTYSQVYLTPVNTGGLRQATKPYPKVLEHITGVPTDFTIAVPGANAKYIWDHFNNQFTHKKNQIVIIYLGTNGGLTNTVNEDAPQGTEPSTWATTQTGYYARIINAYKNVNARIVLVKCYYGGDVKTTNKAIESLAERFGCGVVDEIDLGEPYRLLPSGKVATSMASYHYNDIGYSAFAYALVNEISHMPTKWMKYCLPQVENE